MSLLTLIWRLLSVLSPVASVVCVFVHTTNDCMNLIQLGTGPLFVFGIVACLLIMSALGSLESQRSGSLSYRSALTKSSLSTADFVLYISMRLQSGQLQPSLMDMWPMMCSE